MKIKKWLIILIILILFFLLINFLLDLLGSKNVFDFRATQDTISASVGVVADTTSPTISNALINDTNVVLDTMVKVNATITDNVNNNIDTAIIQYDPPDDEPYNITALQSGDEFYNDTVVLSQLGQWVFTFHANDTSKNNATQVIAQDTAGNEFIEVTEKAVPPSAVGGDSTGAGRKGITEQLPHYDLSIIPTAIATIMEGKTILFSFDNVIKYAIVTKTITENQVILFFTTNKQTTTLNIKDSQEIDLNGDNILDIRITLNSIIIQSNAIAELTLERLSGADLIEEIPKKPKEEIPRVIQPIISKLKEIQELPLLNIIVIFSILTISVLAIVWFQSKFMKKNKVRK